MIVVEYAVAEVLGDDGDVGTRVSRVLKQEHSKELANLYMTAGVASGPHEAAEMIRALQSWAAAEGRKAAPDQPTM